MPYSDAMREQSAHNHSPIHRNTRDLLATKEVATITGFSTSFFEKGRVYGYGPDFLKIRGKVLYRRSAVEAWLTAHECTAKGGDDVRSLRS